MTKYTNEDLKRLQSLSLEEKVQVSIGRIIQWHNFWNGDVYVSFSGGKDSTVLLHLVRSIYPDIPAVFSNTGLEYPEIQKFVKGIENVTIIRPKRRFDEVLTEEGYPLISKENAEAIYYARRRIGKTPPRKRQELQGCREVIQQQNKSNFLANECNPQSQYPPPVYSEYITNQSAEGNGQYQAQAIHGHRQRGSMGQKGSNQSGEFP